ncbi:unnamed protein product, partial [Mesorhabditis spiculigera]
MDAVEAMKESIGVSVYEQLEIRFILYIGFGIAVIICNLICLLVFNSSRDFRRKFMLYSFVSFAELINGVSFLSAGLGRMQLLTGGGYNQPITSSDCIFTFPWPTLLLISGTLPACANLSLSLERLFAVRYASTYRGWSNSHKLILIIASVAVCLILYGLAVMSSLLWPSVSPTRICAVMNSAGPYFGTVHYFLICKAYVIGFLMVVYVYRFAGSHKKLTSSERRTQRTSLVLLGLCVILVAIPNYVLILDNWKIPKFPELLVGIAYCLYACQSMSTLTVFLLFRPEFRERLLGFLCPFRKEGRIESSDHVRTVLHSTIERQTRPALAIHTTQIIAKHHQNDPNRRPSAHHRHNETY